MNTAICKCGSNEFRIEPKMCRVILGSNDAIMVAQAPARVCSRCGNMEIGVDVKVISPEAPAPAPQTEEEMVKEIHEAVAPPEETAPETGGEE